MNPPGAALPSDPVEVTASPTSPSLNPSPKPRQRKRSNPLWMAAKLVTGLLTVSLLGLVALAMTGIWRPWGTTARADLILHTVKYERLQLTVTERGQLEAAENNDITCRVKARSANTTVA